jgi:hypothetical protein
VLEKIGPVKNPLTIIAIFAGLAEVSGTIILPFISSSIQGTYVWFLIFFPILLVVTFFFVLYTKPVVLYAPSDFRDDTIYVKLNKDDYDENKNLAIADVVREIIEKTISNVISDSRKTQEVVNSVTDQVVNYANKYDETNNRDDFNVEFESLVNLVENILVELGVPVTTYKYENDIGADLISNRIEGSMRKVIPIEIKYYKKPLEMMTFAMHLLSRLKRTMLGHDTNESILVISSGISNDLKKTFLDNGVHVVTGSTRDVLTLQLKAIFES